ncbi:MAG: protein phosphatase, partial [Geodermatophilaceae bacterium]|nr:protein phosphatase [Geodermatophilaceae bacterium]
VLVLALVAVVLAGGIYTLWRVSQNQWYVGADGDQVAIFRGMDLSLAGLTLSEVQQTSDLRVADLTSFYRDQVRDGITASDEADADRILEGLRDHLLPPCPSGTEPSDPTESTASESPSASSPSDNPGTFPAPEPTASTAATAPNPTTLPSIATTTTRSSGQTPEPGVDCRSAGD